MTVQTKCYLCQKRPLEPRERANATFMECRNCDSPTGKLPPARPDEYLTR